MTLSWWTNVAGDSTVALALNTRPRKTRGWRTRAEILDEYLQAS
jgi:IS30 family transposase